MLGHSTTTTLTTSWAEYVSATLQLSSHEKLVEYAIRAAFFLLNFNFNAVMWGLFTRALALSSSAVRVNVINTASNFLITAIVGFGLFDEQLPALWFLGAAMLVAGSVIIAARDESPKQEGDKDAEHPHIASEGVKPEHRMDSRNSSVRKRRALDVPKH